METEKQIRYYKQILDAVSSKSTCSKRKVGAIIVRDKCVIGAGYNGSCRGLAHCDDVGHLEYGDSMNENRKKCIRTVHAELNAILTSARNGIAIKGSDMYSLYKPCFQCMKVLINSGIEKCFYFDEYKDEFQEVFERNNYCQFIKIPEEMLK